jgi:hypothetical protein
VTLATETVTIIAILIICAILAIYLAILKRNGWLGGSDKFYRCPNPECKKIFRTPAKVKDLSESHTRIHYACPECGTDIEPYLKTGAFHKTSTEAAPTQQATPKPINLNQRSETQPVTTKSVYLKQKPEIQPTPQQSAPKPTYSKQQSETQSATPKPASLSQKPETQPVTPSQIQIKESQPKQTDKTLKPAITGDNPKTAESSGCQYYFGYLGNRQKNESIPETCLDCPNSLDCMLSKHKLRNSVQEIKKWYPSQS